MSSSRVKGLILLDFVCRMKGKVYERKVDTPDELLARILHAAAGRINRREDQIRRKTRGVFPHESQVN